MSSCLIHKEVRKIMNYELSSKQPNRSFWQTLKSFWPFFSDQKKDLISSIFFLLFNSVTNLISPIIIGIAIDKYIQKGDYHGVIMTAVVLLIVYVLSLVTSYFQTKIMGAIGQRLLFKLRNAVFAKLQELPVEFFNLNKSGDLISRINNDTDKLNQFFSQALMRFVGSFFMMVGTAIFILYLHPKLGIVALSPALLLLIFTQLISAWVKRQNAINLTAVGNMSAEIQESLDNFKVIVAFNRRDFFSEKFNTVNQENFDSSISAGYANNLFTPVYGLAANLAQILVLFYGIYLISIGDFTVGVLISYISYISRFYDPIRQIAGMWSTFQIALAGWDRILAILSLKSNLPMLAEVTDEVKDSDSAVLSFQNVSFRYADGEEVLHKINFELEAGKTYALVGPTGGGKTTTASLMARLYDPTAGKVLLNGRDIRSYNSEERTQKIGFILQEPFLFSGTIRDNILYGNERYLQYSNQELSKILSTHHLERLLARFNQGLETLVTSNGDSISLGQKQLIAFMRIVLRDPELLILDEATANVDTMTEQLLEDILNTLPKSTTKVVIAHRLNTIENADQIFFINSGTATLAGSLKHALAMLLKQKRSS